MSDINDGFLLMRIRSKYILGNIFTNFMYNKLLKIILYNKKIQRKINTIIIQ